MNTTPIPQGITLAHGLTRLHVFAERFQGWCSDYLGDSDGAEADYFDATLTQVWGQLYAAFVLAHPDATTYVAPPRAPGDSVFTARLSQFLQSA
jgi:hypothetical protein